VAGSTYPDRDEWASCYLHATAADAEAIASLGPRGRPGAGSADHGRAGPSREITGQKRPALNQPGLR